MYNKHVKRKKISLATGMILIVMFLFTGCASFDNFKHTFIDEQTKTSKEVMYVGVYEPTSGEFEEQGKDEIKGIELAHKLYSNVNGVDIQLVYADNQSDVHASETAINDLLKMEPIAIIGSAGEASSMVASPYIKKAQVPAITPSAVNPFITQYNEYYFRACITDEQMGAGVAEYATDKLKSSKIGIVKIKNDSSTAAITAGFKKKIRKTDRKGDSIVLEYEIDSDDLKMNGVASQIKAAGVDSLFMPIGTEKADILFSKLEEAGLTDITAMFSKAMNSEEGIALMEKHPNMKMVFPSDNVVTKDNTTKNAITEETQRFLLGYSKMYGDNDIPSNNAALGYDSYLLIVNAINKAKSKSTADVRKALSELNGLPCATGVFRFDEYGNPVRTVNISTIRKGKIVSEYVTKDKSEATKIENFAEEK